jgi:hypothetical protein
VDELKEVQARLDWGTRQLNLAGREIRSLKDGDLTARLDHLAARLQGLGPNGLVPADVERELVEGSVVHFQVPRAGVRPAP